MNLKNINVNELSRRTGISNQTIYSIIKRDNMKADFEVLLKICTALDVDIDCFYSDYVSNKKNNFITLTDHEKELLLAYRAKPEMQASIDKLLDISHASDTVADDIVNTINSASPAKSPISKK